MHPKKIIFCGRRLYDDQVPVVYALNHWSEDREGNRLAPRFRLLVIAKLIEVEVSLLWANDLALWDNPNSLVSRQAAEFAKPQRYFWARKAFDMQIQYEKDEWKLPDWSQKELQEHARRVLGSPPLPPQRPTGQ